MTKNRCNWCVGKPDYERYHDTVWGKPEYDSQKLFAMLCLEGQQAGLSWYTILVRWDSYHLAYDDFDPYKISQYDERKYQDLMHDEGVIRNRLKVQSIMKNAKAYMSMKEQGIDFSNWLWSYTGHKPIINNWKSLSEVPAETELSKQISKDLKKLGFSFVGPTIVYAFMQATGMVNDHLTTCDFR